MSISRCLAVTAAGLALAACAIADDPPDLGGTAKELITERNATVSAGLDHSCSVEADGRVRCWGRNAYGQLGNGTTADTPTPVNVVGITTAVAVTAGRYHTCAALTDGTARCWGLGTSGQLGDGASASRLIPVVVSGLTGVTSISAGNVATCASIDVGQARCWGANTYGQLGNGSTTAAPTALPVGTRASTGRILPLTGVAEVETGAAFACARLSSGAVSCWGRNQYGQLGDGTTTQHTSPVAVSGLSATSDLAVGDNHACAVTSVGRARCWGNNLMGQLGDGSQTARATPVEVRRRLTPTLTYPIVGVTAVAAGQYHTCLRSSGELWCVGRNDDGQLGRDASSQLELLAVSSSPVLVVSEVAAGGNHTCARRPGGGVVCVGRDTFGQVGDVGRCPRVPTATITSVTSPGAHQLHKTDGRGDIYYTDGDALDVTVETTTCAQVDEVGFKWGPITPDVPIEPSDGLGYQVTTVDRADGVRELHVHLGFGNGHGGATYPVSVRVVSPAGEVAAAGFTLAEALHVSRPEDGVDDPLESAGAIDLGEAEIRNAMLQAMYDKFGDYNYWTRDGVNLYALDFEWLAVNVEEAGIAFSAKVKADLIPGPGLAECDPTAYVKGRFKIVPVDGELTTQWVDDVSVTAVPPVFTCTLPSLGLGQLAALFVGAFKDDNVEDKIAKRVGELTDLCPDQIGCEQLIKSVTHRDGSVRVELRPLFDSVSFLQPYRSSQLGSASVGDPMRRGIALPTTQNVLLVTGGVADGCSTQACDQPLHTFGAGGLFNWNWEPLRFAPGDDQPWGAHPPILDPWPCSDLGCASFPGRQGPWLRLEGLRRDLTAILAPDRNVGSVLARVIHADGTTSGLLYAGDYACGLRRPLGDAARLVVGRNDIPTGPLDGEYARGDAIVTIVFTSGEVVTGCPDV